MDLEELRQLPLNDQVSMLVGLSVRYAIELEGALRSVLTTLRGAKTGRQQFSSIVKEFRRLVTERDEFSDDVRASCLASADDAERAYAHRSRNAHDLLDAYSFQQIERFRFERVASVEDLDLGAESERLSWDHLVEVCVELLHATWRIRGVILYLQRPNERERWDTLLKGDFEARWDGTARSTRVM